MRLRPNPEHANDKSQFAGRQVLPLSAVPKQDQRLKQQDSPKGPQRAPLSPGSNHEGDQMADKQTLKDLLEDEIKDLYSAERQLTKAIPKMAKGSHDAALSTAFTNHLKETEQQVARLEEVGKLLDIKPAGKKCQGMEGVIKEGAEALEEEGNETVLDLGIIGAGSRVEHYEMAGYLTAISLAERMGAKEVVSLLQKSLAEEQAAEQTLRKIASGLIKSATATAAA
jgi:ferritin-like metal-binding protein YciE